MTIRPSRIKKAAAAGLLSLVALGGVATVTAGTAHAYDARVTVEDLKAAGATPTAGGGYALNGRIWSCGGAKYCTSVRSMS